MLFIFCSWCRCNVLVYNRYCALLAMECRIRSTVERIIFTFYSLWVFYRVVYTWNYSWPWAYCFRLIASYQGFCLILYFKNFFTINRLNSGSVHDQNHSGIGCGHQLWLLSDLVYTFEFQNDLWSPWSSPLIWNIMVFTFQLTLRVRLTLIFL